MSTPFWMWLLFFAIIISLLVIDLGILNKKNRVIHFTEGLLRTIAYIVIALLFNIFVYYNLGSGPAEEFLTGYIIEKSLSLDNIFVMSMVFKYFHTPLSYQHRILFWGILSALILRGIMIGLGAELLSQFHSVIYILSIFLIFTGIRMLVVIDSKPDISKSFILQILKKYLRISEDISENKFFLKRTVNNRKRIYCTILFVTLLMIEFVDIIFAIDSVPAILAITSNTFIIYTSNIFAILGLRALYFAISAIIRRFVYLNQAISIVLIFIGAKTFIADFVGLEKFPIKISLFITVGVIAFGIFYSLYKTKKSNPNPDHRH